MFNGHPLQELVYSATMRRKFHSWFTWDVKDAKSITDKTKGVNTFFGLFGNRYSTNAKKRLNADEDLKQAAGSFIHLGYLRNNLVHRDFATYTMKGMTVKDIYDLYQDAEKFVDWALENLQLYIGELANRRRKRRRCWRRYSARRYPRRRLGRIPRQRRH